MIVINRNTKDIHNRYKMPPLVIKYEGKNTGIKTVLVNLDDISKSLSRKSEHILKYISYSLSLQTKSNNKYIISGRHEQPLLQNILYDFIDHFVLCYNCENPETFFILQPALKIECLACGSKSSVYEHKLNAEISKNITPPTTIYTEFISTEEECDKILTTEELYNECKNKGFSDEEIIMKILKDSEDIYDKLNFIIKKISIKVLLGVYESYVETYKKYEKIGQFIDHLLQQGVKKNEINKFYTRPQSGKKRSVEFKKEINKYFN